MSRAAEEHGDWWNPDDPTLRRAVQDGLVYGKTIDDLYAAEDADEKRLEERDRRRQRIREENHW